jgi:hypothetical protein
MYVTLLENGKTNEENVLQDLALKINPPSFSASIFFLRCTRASLLPTLINPSTPYTNQCLNACDVNF